MNSTIELLNNWGRQALQFAWPILCQSTVLIGIVFGVDLALRRKLRAAVRYSLWLVVLLKLVLPASLAVPTGITWWLPREAVPAPSKSVAFQGASFVGSGTVTVPISRGQTSSAFVPPSEPPKPALSLAAGALLISITISVSLLVIIFFGWRRISAEVRRADSPPDWLTDVFRMACQQANVRWAVHLRLTEGPVSPALCGLFRPVVLLPKPLVNLLSPIQIRSVFLHELMHLRRGDVLVSLVQSLLQIVYWWHPLLWVANSRIRRLREEAVDDCVMLALREDAETYSLTLLEVARMTLRRPLASLGLVGILESKHSLRKRIERLANFSKPNTPGLTCFSVSAVLAFAAVAVPMGKPAVGQTKSVIPPKTEVNSWPARSFDGHERIALEVQFFSVDADRLGSAFPSLIDTNSPVIAELNGPAMIEAGLRRSHAEPCADFEQFKFEQFSGGRFHYRIGDDGSNGISHAIKETTVKRTSSGADIDIAVKLRNWAPIEFNLDPTAEEGFVRCKLQLSSAGNSSVAQETDVVIPPGCAIIWGKPDAKNARKMQLVTLRNTETALEAEGSIDLEGAWLTNSTNLESTTLKRWIKSNKLAQEGRALMESGDLDQANKKFSEVLTENPQSLGFVKTARGQAMANRVAPILDKVVSIHLDNIPLGTLLLNLSQSTGVNIVADKSLAALTNVLVASVGGQTNLNNVKLGEFFRYVERNYGLQFQIGDNLVWVVDAKGANNIFAQQTRFFRLAKTFVPNVKQRRELEKAIKERFTGKYTIDYERNLVVATGTTEQLEVMARIIQAIGPVNGDEPTQNDRVIPPTPRP